MAYNNATNNIPNANLPAHQLIISQAAAGDCTGLTLALNQVPIGQTGADPISISITSLFDTVFGSSQGDILYRNSTGWVVLAPGTSGKVLETLGVAANPQWSSLSTLGALLAANNLSDVSSASSSLANLGGLPLTGGTLSGALNLGGNQINNMATPSANGDAATKLYVDNAVAGVNPAVSVYAATTANLTGYTYNNGSSGVGATLTAPSNGVFTTDGQTPPVGSRILYKNDTTGSGAYNGIYTLTTSSSGVPAVLTRATDYNSPSNINNTGIVPVINGTLNGGSGWYQTATIVSVGVTPLVFVEFGNTGTVSSVATNNGVTGGTITSTGTIGLAAIANNTLLANISGGSLYPSSTTLTALIDAAIGNTQGDILYRNASGWVVLAPSTAGYLLQTGGAAANPSWVTPSTFSSTYTDTFLLMGA